MINSRNGPIMILGGKNGDSHEFLTTCRELPETIEFVDSHGVRHAMAIIQDETEMISRFVRGLNFSIKSVVFKASQEEASFQSIVKATNEVELMERIVYGDPKRARISGYDTWVDLIILWMVDVNVNLRDIDFAIDLEQGTKPIYIPPYHMSPTELKKLKDQLQDLMSKGFILPNTLPKEGVDFTVYCDASRVVLGGVLM
ncbi:hypothetical protein MTR67_052592 [Solanum verrucosum]|uniref:Reverse transcriptase/retrotransposon-derived protein RNase H-like domain-containing protein n=1 Tax=Solanum verrucosum TaxID=315347 RepID=A0AAF1A025_SOLVR|nr:hypothetical protein MTR67_052592 [Solanum verrucosum]